MRFTTYVITSLIFLALGTSLALGQEKTKNIIFHNSYKDGKHFTKHIVKQGGSKMVVVTGNMTLDEII